MSNKIPLKNLSNGSIFQSHIKKVPLRNSQIGNSQWSNLKSHSDSQKV